MEAAAWTFLVENMHAINARALWVCSKYPSIDVDDFRHELLLYCFERSKRYDSTRGAPSTWIRHQARAVLKTMLQGQCRNAVEVECNVGRSRAAVGAAAIEARAEVALMVGKLSVPYVDALNASLQGLTGPEMKKEIGVTLTGQKVRMRKIAAQFGDYAA